MDHILPDNVLSLVSQMMYEGVTEDAANEARFKSVCSAFARSCRPSMLVIEFDEQIGREVTAGFSKGLDTYLLVSLS